MMKKFLTKHLFARPINFSCNSIFPMICGLIIIFSPITSCGPSKAELEARAKKGEIWNSDKGGFEKTVNGENIYEKSVKQEEPLPTHEDLYYPDIEIRVIDSCEYIFWSDPHNVGNMIHKANCRNPIHHNNGN